MKKVIAGVLLLGLLVIATYSVVIDYNSNLTGSVVEGCGEWEGNGENIISPSEDENVDLSDKFKIQYPPDTLLFLFSIVSEDTGCEQRVDVAFTPDFFTISSIGPHQKYEMDFKKLFDEAEINNPQGRYRIIVVGLQYNAEIYSQFRVNFGAVDSDSLVTDINFDDSSGYELKNGAKITESGLNKILRLDGVDDYVKLNTNIDFTKPYSILMWVKVDDWSKRNRDPNVHESQTLIQQRCNGCESGSKGAMIVGIPSLDDWNMVGIEGDKYVGVGDKISFMAGRDRFDSDKWTFGYTKIDTGKWYHVAVVYTGKDARVYVNGDLESNDFLGDLVSGHNTELVLGGVPSGFGTGWKYFNGEIDNVKIYQKPLTTLEIRDLIEVQINSLSIANTQCDDGKIEIICTASKDYNRIYPYYSFPGNTLDTDRYFKENGEVVLSWNISVDNTVNGEYEVGCYIGDNLQEKETKEIGLGCGDICNNEIDDDNDGLIDCFDSDCFDDPICSSPVKVFVFGGQSNMYPPLITDEFYRIMSERYPDEEIVIVKQAIGGTDLNFSWNSRMPECSEVLDTDCEAIVDESSCLENLRCDWTDECIEFNCQYYHLEEKLDDKLQRLEDAGKTYEIISFYWLQGEADSIVRDYAYNYQLNFNNLINDFREKYGSDIGVVIARIAVDRTYSEIVRDAQVSVAESNEKINWFSTDDLPTRDGVHFTADAQLVLAQRFVDSSSEFLSEEGLLARNMGDDLPIGETSVNDVEDFVWWNPFSWFD